VSPAPAGALQATLLIIGDELLAGEIVDRNGPWLAERLAAEGWVVREIRTLPDDTATLADALRQARVHSQLIVASGGLGPTSDDRTTEAVARARGVETVCDEAAWAAIRALFEDRGRTVPAGNDKQALVPRGAQVLPNPRGTAPGHLSDWEGCLLAVLPGPPRENRGMFEEALAPRLRQRFPDAPRRHTDLYRVFGLPESAVGHKLADLEERFPAVRLGYQARFPEILVKLRYDSGHAAEAQEGGRYVQQALGPAVYGTGEAMLPEVLGRACAAQGLRLVTAESCTAGLVAKLLTDVDGSSAWMERGFVTYSNEAKTELLDVPAALLAEHGAVSEPVAEAMVRGALAHSRAELGVSLTGIAGPKGSRKDNFEGPRTPRRNCAKEREGRISGNIRPPSDAGTVHGSAAESRSYSFASPKGGTPEKPVGTVCVGWGDAEAVHTKTYHFPFDRDRNRVLSAWAALGRLYRFLSRRAE